MNVRLHADEPGYRGLYLVLPASPQLFSMYSDHVAANPEVCYALFFRWVPRKHYSLVLMVELQFAVQVAQQEAKLVWLLAEYQVNAALVV
jgi:hypothetical protein